MAEALVADHVLHFPYTRSTGPVIGAFLTGLRDGRILGIRAEDDRVLVPPQEYDPVTAADLGTDRLVEVGTSGGVTSWSWNPSPRDGQPFEDRPFAWALVLLDGADTPLLLALDVGSPDEVETGMRVQVRWAADRVGSILDIACVEPATEVGPTAPLTEECTDPVTVVTLPQTVPLEYTAGPVEEIFLKGTQERRLLGRRCSQCHKVYLPPRGVCSMCGADFTHEIVEVEQVGTVATFAIVNVPFAGQEVEIPYAAVEVLWDGAHITTQFLFRGAATEDVRMGMRVKAVWKEGDLQPTLSNITHVEPVDEPDAPFESYAEYV